MSNPLLRRPLQDRAQQFGERYGCLGLLENPFPLNASLNPQSDDPRVNGEIYCDSLHQPKAETFRKLLIPTAENPKSKALVYLMDSASRKGRGIGKSAFLRRQNSSLMKDLGANASSGSDVIFSVVVTPSASESSSYKRFGEFCRLIIESMIDQGIITLAVARIRALSGLISDEKLSSISSNEELQAKLLSDHWIDGRDDGEVPWDSLSRKVQKHVVRVIEGIGLSSTFAHILAHSDLTVEWLRDHWFDKITTSEWRKSGPNILFDWLPRLFEKAEFTKGLILVDEVEKVVTPMNQPELRAFADCLRQVLFDGNVYNTRSGFYGMLLTIHPYIQELLSPHWEAAGLDRLAAIHEPAGQEYRIDFPQLDLQMARPLVQVYLERYRALNSSSQGIEPFDDEAVTQALVESGRLPGLTLNLLHRVVEIASDRGINQIDSGFIQSVASGTSSAVDELSAQMLDLEPLAPAKVDLHN